MANTQVPHVAITEIVSPITVGDGQVVIGVIGTSEKGSTTEITRITSAGAAESVYGTNTANGADLVKLIRKSFQEGASIVKAISIGTPTEAQAGTTLSANVAAGETDITVTLVTGIDTDDIIYVGTGDSYKYEEKRVVASVLGDVVTLTQPLSFAHYSGETVTEITAKIDTDYTDAITLMEQDEEKSLVVCESELSTVTTALKTMVENSFNNYSTPCVLVLGSPWTEAEDTVDDTAIAHNNKRVILAYPNLVDYDGRTYSAGESAAAVAGVISRNGVPKLNHNLSSFTGAAAVNAKVTTADTLIAAGVTVLRTERGSVQLVRLLTTKTTEGGIPDNTWVEGAVRLNVDNIQLNIQRRIQGKFLQSGNSSQVREAIKQEIISALESFANDSIIVDKPERGLPAYQTPVVTTDTDDDTQVNCEISICMGKPLNFIELSFRVTV